VTVRVAALVAACLVAPLARADLGINIYGLSWHIEGDEARKAGVDNWFNPGLGLRYRIPGERFDTFFDAGVYHDSGRNTAVVAGGAVHWRATESARLGIALAVFNSQTYNNGKTFVTPLPVAAWDFGRGQVNVMYAPKVEEINHVNTLSFWLTWWLP
jgi:hypothetical protein